MLYFGTFYKAKRDLPSPCRMSNPKICIHHINIFFCSCTTHSFPIILSPNCFLFIFSINQLQHAFGANHDQHKIMVLQSLMALHTFKVIYCAYCHSYLRQFQSWLFAKMCPSLIESIKQNSHCKYHLHVCLCI